MATPPATRSTDGLVIEWTKRSGDPGLGALDDFVGIAEAAVFKNRFYLLGRGLDANDDLTSKIWSSANGLDWRVELQVEDSGILRTVAATSDAIVVTGELPEVGDAIWLSNDGAFNEPPFEAGLSGVRSLVADGDGFMAMGSSVWTSADGRQWSELTTPSAQDVADAVVVELAADASGFVALTQAAESKPVTAWTSTVGDEWTKAGTLSDSRYSTVSELVATPLGWFATGDTWVKGRQPNRTWTSTDGATWLEVAGPDRPVRDILPTEAGLIAVGYEYVNPGCALNPADIQGYTWTSVDGRAWEQMDADTFRFRRIDQLLRDGRTLIGVGMAYENEDDYPGEGTVWTARLPAIGTSASELYPPGPNGPGCG